MRPTAGIGPPKSRKYNGSCRIRTCDLLLLRRVVSRSRWLRRRVIRRPQGPEHARRGPRRCLLPGVLRPRHPTDDPRARRALPMSGARPTLAPDCTNDAGGQCAPCLALRTCTLVLRRKLLHGYVLRFRTPSGRSRTGRSAGDGTAFGRPRRWRGPVYVFTRHGPGEVAPVQGSLREGRQTDALGIDDCTGQRHDPLAESQPNDQFSPLLRLLRQGVPGLLPVRNGWTTSSEYATGLSCPARYGQALRLPLAGVPFRVR